MSDMLDKIEKKVDADAPLSKAEVIWICSETRRLQSELNALKGAALVALEGLNRFATNFSGTIRLRAVLRGVKSTGTNSGSGPSTSTNRAKYVEPLL